MIKDLYNRNETQLTEYIQCDKCGTVYDLNDYDTEVQSREAWFTSGCANA